VNKKRLDKLQNIILQVLKKMDSPESKGGIPHERWAVQDEVCKKYMEYFGMVGYDPERMSDNISDHPDWEDNPRFNDFFIVERSTDLRGTPYVFLRNAASFSEAFFHALIHLARKGLVKLDMRYERNKVGCCGATAKRDDSQPEPHALKDIQKIGLTEGF
jgi:hypothetical protein